MMLCADDVFVYICQLYCIHWVVLQLLHQHVAQTTKTFRQCRGLHLSSCHVSCQFRIEPWHHPSPWATHWPFQFFGSCSSLSSQLGSWPAFTSVITVKRENSYDSLRWKRTRREELIGMTPCFFTISENLPHTRGLGGTDVSLRGTLYPVAKSL